MTFHRFKHIGPLYIMWQPPIYIGDKTFSMSIFVRSQKTKLQPLRPIGITTFYYLICYIFCPFKFYLINKFYIKSFNIFKLFQQSPLKSNSNFLFPLWSDIFILLIKFNNCKLLKYKWFNNGLNMFFSPPFFNNVRF